MSTTPPRLVPDPDLLRLIAAWVGDGRLGLADLGYEGEPDIFMIPFKRPKAGALTLDQRAYNAVHGALRRLGERCGLRDRICRTRTSCT